MSASPRRAVVFPGQGAQKPGMARDFYDAFATVREAFAEASDGAGVDLAEIVFGEDPSRLDLTEYTQPCLLATEIGMLRALQSEFGLEAELFAGHSLGEYTALVAAGALSLGDAAHLVRRRGALMQQAVPPGEGAMAAAIGGDLDPEEVRKTLDGLEVDIANHNSPSQLVLSGLRGAVDAACARLAAPGRRFVRLNVSAPFHSRFMRPVEPRFAEELSRVAIDVTFTPQVASNFTGVFHTADAEEVRQNLVRQITGTVRWVDNMEALAAEADRIVEVGPARPLSAFFREIGVAVTAIVSLKTAEKAFREPAERS
ncbi:MAG: malonyl CoA-acyl carrier protein transacylase [Candidatus Binatia bacterium]|nr:MAG: malonyl CoA-acyl carrier protein transacylase [Candidatus Binatia bacterium]